MATKFFILVIIFAILVSVGYFYVKNFQQDKVIFFDVGQGDSILVHTKENYNVLIDGGPDKKVLFKLGENLPFYERKIDLVILTHPHADHVTGLVEILKNYDVRKVGLVGSLDSSKSYLEFLKVIKEKNITVRKLFSGEELNIHTLDLKILSPEKDNINPQNDDLNDASVVIKLNFKNKDFLFMGDAGIDIEKYLLENFTIDYLKSDILKIGHHGSEYSSSEDFLKVVDPKIAVISVGENKFGHPSLRILKRLERFGIQIFRTDLDSDIVF